MLGVGGCHVLLPYSPGQPAADARPEKSAADSRSPDVSSRPGDLARADSVITRESTGPKPDRPPADSRPRDKIPPVDVTKKKEAFVAFDMCVPPNCPTGQKQCSTCPCLIYKCVQSSSTCPQIACP